MNPIIQQILKEEGATGVDQFYYDEELQCWILSFKDDNIEGMGFSSFSEMYHFISNGL